MKAVKHQFNPRRNPQLIEDPEQVVTDDLLRSRGWTARQVALACYAITLSFAVVAWWGARNDSPAFWLAVALSALLLIVSAVMLGSLRSENKGWRPRKRACEISKDLAGSD